MRKGGDTRGRGLLRAMPAMTVFVASCAAACSFPAFQADVPSGDTSIAEDVAQTDSAHDALDALDARDTSALDAADTLASDAPDASDADADEAGVCGAPPTLHPPATGAGVYCPFVPDGGATTCKSGEVCCEDTTGSTSSCKPGVLTACSTGTVAWMCDAQSQCPSGHFCCGNGSPTVRPGCPYEWIHPVQGTICAASCGTEQFRVCEADAECPLGQRCHAIKSGGVQIGYCK